MSNTFLQGEQNLFEVVAGLVLPHSAA